MEWYESLSDLIEFAHILVDADWMDSADGLLYYFEKPEKWIPEHDVWVAHGSPTTESENWDLFTTALVKLWRSTWSR